MPLYNDFQMNYVDGILTVELAPPQSIVGWSLKFEMSKRLGGTSIVQKYAASGFNNVSGINVVNASQGIMNIQLRKSEVSGLDPGAYSFKVTRTDSGSATELVEGYRVMSF